MTIAPRNMLEKGLSELGIAYTSDQIEQWMQLSGLLLKWNQSYNLTSLTSPHDVIVKHLLDSLAVAGYLKSGPTLDVGTGPGFPGLPLAILYPDRRFSLLDSNAKKIRFITQVCIELKLSNVTTHHQRIEDHSISNYQQITSRAFSSIKNYFQMCYHLTGPDGLLLAMKGKMNADELSCLDSQAGTVITKPLDIPFLQESRHLVIVRKNSVYNEARG